MILTMDKPGPALQAAKETCYGCDSPIDDRFLLRVAGNSWHEACLQCCMCDIQLFKSCFMREGKLYCKVDYDKVYGVKCLTCAECIPSQELVMRAGGYVFHLECFQCSCCGVRLQKGDEFVINVGSLYCRTDYEKLLLDDDSDADNGCNSKENMILQDGEFTFDGDKSEDGKPEGKGLKGGGKQSNRKRVILTTHQRRTFRAAFDISQKPCRKVKERLAVETGLPVRIVQVWFQNERAKVKKMARRQAQEQQDGGRRRARGRGETYCDEDLYRERVPDHLIGPMSDIPPEHFAFPPPIRGPPVIWDPEFYPNYPEDPAFQGSPGVINPMDKLNSMQNSYFTASD